MYIIERDFYFSAAHYLPKHTGKCKNLHGHTWKVTVRLQGEELINGISIDFSIMKKVIQPWMNRLDHTCLNENPDVLLNNPTAENICSLFVIWFSKVTTYNLHSITVEESRDCRVTYIPGGKYEADN